VVHHGQRVCNLHCNCSMCVCAVLALRTQAGKWMFINDGKPTSLSCSPSIALCCDRPVRSPTPRSPVISGDKRPVKRDGAVLTSAGTARNDRRAALLARRRGPQARIGGGGGARILTPRPRRSARRCSLCRFAPKPLRTEGRVRSGACRCLQVCK
jgi:hypothetical protein